MTEHSEMLALAERLESLATVCDLASQRVGNVDDGLVAVRFSKDKWALAAVELRTMLAALSATTGTAVDREAVARVLCQSGKFETGQGTCAVLCMDQLGDIRKKGCGHCARVHGKLADAILSLLHTAAPVELANAWRPIEAAPKGDPDQPGRNFEIIIGGGLVKDESLDLLGWKPFDGWALACYDTMRGCWRGENTGQHDYFYLHKPTHWMPKFAGPAQSPTAPAPDAKGEPVAWDHATKGGAS